MFLRAEGPVLHLPTPRVLSLTYISLQSKTSTRISRPKFPDPPYLRLLTTSTFLYVPWDTNLIPPRVAVFHLSPTLKPLVDFCSYFQVQFKPEKIVPSGNQFTGLLNRLRRFSPTLDGVQSFSIHRLTSDRGPED